MIGAPSDDEAYVMKPRSDVANLPMFGNTSGTSDLATPYHEARVAAYCSTDAVGIQRPRLSVSLGPLSCSTGNTVPLDEGDHGGCRESRGSATKTGKPYTIAVHLREELCGEKKGSERIPYNSLTLKTLEGVDAAIRR